MNSTVLFVSSYFKSLAFFEAARQAGCRAVLLSVEALRDESWPVLDAIQLLPDLEDSERLLAAATELAGKHPIRLVFPLDEGDVESAALVRQHLGLPGPSPTVAHNFRDKLTMMQLVNDHGVYVPPFTGLTDPARLETFLEQVQPDWIVKPRSKAGSKGVSKVSSRQQLNELLEQLGEERSQYLLEQCVAGDVFHVDSIVFSGSPVFAQAHRYGTPPFEICSQGGVFSSRSLVAGDADLSDLLSLNRKVIAALQLPQGITHAEFIRCRESGRLCFLEIAARVAGANLDVLVHKATEVNLWLEWIRVELAAAQRRDYQPPPCQRKAGGMLTCLAGIQRPDLSCLHSPEVVWELDLDWHAGMVVVSQEPAVLARVMEHNEGWLRENVLAQ